MATLVDLVATSQCSPEDLDKWLVELYNNDSDEACWKAGQFYLIANSDQTKFLKKLENAWGYRSAK